jgi:hypothetical protein
MRSLILELRMLANGSDRLFGMGGDEVFSEHDNGIAGQPPSPDW